MQARISLHFIFLELLHNFKLLFKEICWFFFKRNCEKFAIDQFDLHWKMFLWFFPRHSCSVICIVSTLFSVEFFLWFFPRHSCSVMYAVSILLLILSLLELFFKESLKTGQLQGVEVYFEMIPIDFYRIVDNRFEIYFWLFGRNQFVNCFQVFPRILTALLSEIWLENNSYGYLRKLIGDLDHFLVGAGVGLLRDGTGALTVIRQLVEVGEVAVEVHVVGVGPPVQPFTLGPVHGGQRVAVGIGRGQQVDAGGVEEPAHLGVAARVLLAQVARQVEDELTAHHLVPVNVADVLELRLHWKNKFGSFHKNRPEKSSTNSTWMFGVGKGKESVGLCVFHRWKLKRSSEKTLQNFSPSKILIGIGHQSGKMEWGICVTLDDPPLGSMTSKTNFVNVIFIINRFLVIKIVIAASSMEVNLRKWRIMFCEELICHIWTQNIDWLIDFVLSWREFSTSQGLFQGENCSCDWVFKGKIVCVIESSRVKLFVWLSLQGGKLFVWLSLQGKSCSCDWVFKGKTFQKSWFSLFSYEKQISFLGQNKNHVNSFHPQRTRFVDARIVRHLENQQRRAKDGRIFQLINARDVRAFLGHVQQYLLQLRLTMVPELHQRRSSRSRHRGLAAVNAETAQQNRRRVKMAPPTSDHLRAGQYGELSGRAACHHMVPEHNTRNVWNTVCKTHTTHNTHTIMIWHGKRKKEIPESMWKPQQESPNPSGKHDKQGGGGVKKKREKYFSVDAWCDVRAVGGGYWVVAWSGQVPCLGPHRDPIRIDFSLHFFHSFFRLGIDNGWRASKAGAWPGRAHINKSEENEKKRERSRVDRRVLRPVSVNSLFKSFLFRTIHVCIGCSGTFGWFTVQYCTACEPYFGTKFEGA